MNFKYSYPIYVSLFLLLWIIVYINKEEYKKQFLIFSLLAAFAGPISEIWFLRDYWQRPTLTGIQISIEDYLFGFAIGGLAFSVYSLFTKGKFVPASKYKPKKWLLFLSPCLIILMMIVLTNFIKLNSIFSSSIAFLTLLIIIWTNRKDLIIPAIKSGALLFLLFIIIYQSLNLIFPDYLLHWCKGCNPTGIRFLGINIEELIWDFLWGALGGILYPAYKGYGFIYPEGKYLSSYKAFEEYSFSRIKKSYKSEFSHQLNIKSSNVFSIWFNRKIAYKISKFFKHVIPIEKSAVIFSTAIPLTYLIFNEFFGVFDLNLFLALAYYGIFHFLFFLFSKLTWDGLIATGDSIYKIVRSNREREAIFTWFYNRMNFKFQLILSIIGAAFGISVFTLVADKIEVILSINMLSYISVVITSAIGITIVYWLWTIPLLVYNIYKSKSQNLNWIDPNNTVALYKIKHLLSLSAIYAAVGAVTFITPIVWFITNQESPNSIPSINLFAFLICFGSVFFISILPQYWLSAIASRQRVKSLEKLGKAIEKDNKNISDPNHTMAQIELYRTIRKKSVVSIDPDILSNYIIAILTTVITLLDLQR